MKKEQYFDAKGTIIKNIIYSTLELLIFLFLLYFLARFILSSRRPLARLSLGTRFASPLWIFILPFFYEAKRIISFARKLIGDKNTSRKLYSGKLTFIGKNRRKHFFLDSITLQDESGHDQVFYLPKSSQLTLFENYYVLYGINSRFVFKLVKGVPKHRSSTPINSIANMS